MKNNHEYLKGAESNGSCLEKYYHWIKRNFKTFVLVLVALTGLILALANFLEPCIQEAIVSLNEVPFTNITTVEESFIRLVPMDMHVALDHSGSLRDEFEQAKTGIIALMDGTLNSTEAIAQSPKAVAGSKAELQFAFSKWNNREPRLISALQNNFQTAVDKVKGFTTIPAGGTALSTGLASCVDSLLPQLAPTRAPNVVPSATPTTSPTLTPTAAPTRADLDEVVTTSGGGDQSTTKSCLVVTDGVTFDHSQTFLPNLSDQDLEDECEEKTRNYNALNEHQLDQSIINSMLNDCGNGMEDTGLPSVLKACAVLGLKGVNCTTKRMATEMRKRGIIIVGMYLGQATLDIAFGQPFLRNITSCIDDIYPKVNGSETCPFFVSTSATDIVGAATILSSALVDSFASQTVSQVTTFTNTTTVLKEETTYICAGEPLYFLFLMFMIPLAAYLLWRPLTLLFSKYCFAPPRKYEDPVFTLMPATALAIAPTPHSPMPQVMEARNAPPSWHPTPEAVLPVSPPPKPEPNTLIEEKRYKWSLKASDNYLWNLGAAGVGPMHVNFGGAAPPSAPKLEAKEENMNRRTQRVSMRWSYVPPQSRASARASTRITSVLHDVIVPNYERASDRLEPFQEDEMQPGDLDYEYTMCLMRWFPCLRPRKPEQQAEQQQENQAGSGFGNYNNNNNSPNLQGNNSSMSTISAAHGRTANPRFGNETGFGEPSDDHFSHAPSEYAPSQYARSEYPSEEFGTRPYAQQNENGGQSAYGSQSAFGGSEYGGQSEIGNKSEYGHQSEYGNQSEYARDREYSGKSDVSDSFF